MIDQLLTTAQAHAKAGRIKEAAGACEQVLQTQPRNPHALFLLGFLLHQAGQWQPALQRLTQAVQANRGSVEPHFLIGLIHQQQRDLASAIVAYQEALRLQPRHGKAMNNLGRALLDHGRISQGIEVLKRAVVDDPRNASAYSNLGDGFRLSGDFEAAVMAQRRAIAIDPNFAEAHSNLGVALAKQGKIPEAIQCMRRAIEINPRLATPHFNLARVFQDQGKLDEAIRHCRTAVQLRPLYPDAINLLGNLAGMTGDVPNAIAAQRRAVELQPNHAAAHSNLLLSLHYIDDLTPQQIYTAHCEWAALHGKTPDRSFDPRPLELTTPRRLRIGYLSPNFSNHSVAYFIEPILAAHDRSEFEIFCYANVSNPDSVTSRLRSYAEHWNDISGQSDAVIVEKIRRDEIDILVDLAGHTSDNRMTVFAAKPAPIQVTWLGYPDTSGLATMDYRITDAIADPPGVSDQLHIEKLIRIPGGCWAYQPPVNAPVVGAGPAAANGFITFGSFNNLPKLTPAVLKSWARILDAVPDSRLLVKALGLSSELGRQHVLNNLTSTGIDAHRIELMSWRPTTTSHLELYHRVDIALDTFPYNGTTTTCEAMWMGVPVISFTGQSHAGRVGASLLTHAGYSEWLGDNVEDYIARAVQLSGDVDHLSRLRTELRATFSASPMCDGRRLCRSLEQSFQEMFQRYIQRIGCV